MIDADAWQFWDKTKLIFNIFCLSRLKNVPAPPSKKVLKNDGNFLIGKICYRGCILFYQILMPFSYLFVHI